PPNLRLSLHDALPISASESQRRVTQFQENTMSATSHIQTLHPGGWKPARGYSNGMVAEGRTVWLGGQIGWNGDQVFETDDFVGQDRKSTRLNSSHVKI